ncbi:MAG: phosphate transport system substrate-binding protein [Bacteroidetes bacterium]|nr:MAG: phosphate transport system substrate-binding protein [Bacteroidota bacterium]
MKTTISFIVGLLLMIAVTDVRSEKAVSNNTAAQQGNISITCTPALYQLASGWATEYTGLHPDVNISVIKSTDIDAELKTAGTSGIFMDFSGSAADDQAFRSMVVGRNIIVPVMNQQNPYKERLLQKGVSPEMFAGIFSHPDKQQWGTFTAEGQALPMHIYIINDEATKAGVAKFLKSSRIPEEGITFGDKAVILEAIQKDPLAIGFCNVTDIVSGENQDLVANLSLLPIDRNGNGNLDYMEDIYGDLNHLMRGVWIGKYPGALYENIYAISSARTSDDAETAFLKWMITGGQKNLKPKGYCDLVNTEIRSQLDRIDEASIIVPPAQTGKTGAGLVLTLLLLAAAAVIISGIVLSRLFYRKGTTLIPAIPVKVFDENSFNVPKGLWFDKNHTWAFMESDGKVKIGIDDFIQHITGPITRVEMKNPGEKIKKGELLLSIVQSGKQLNMYAPVSGTILKQNETLNRMSSGMNDAPFTNGWVYMVEPSNWYRDIQVLEMAERYERFLRTEFLRVKDFLAATLKPESPEYAHVVLQDGGQLMDGVLSGFGPEVWEDFQTIFLDNAGKKH